MSTKCLLPSKTQLIKTMSDGSADERSLPTATPYALHPASRSTAPCDALDSGQQHVDGAQPCGRP